MKEKRNYYIDFLKFIFSLIIVCYHSWIFSETIANRYFGSGYLAVDFYFIVTGYLFIKTVEKYIKKYPKKEGWELLPKFILSKLKVIYPGIIITTIIGYILIFKDNLFDYSILFSNGLISELSFTGLIGYGMPINTACWYISVMLIILLFTFPFAYKNKEKYSYQIAPLLIILCLGIIKYNNINIYDPLNMNSIFINGFYQGIIFINLGVISCEIVKHLKKVKKTKINRIIFTLLESFIYIFLIANMHYFFAGTYLTGILFTAGVTITFSNLSYTSEIFRFKFFQKLGEFGFYLFLSNIPIRRYLLTNYENVSYRRTFLIFIALSILLALTTSILIFVIKVIYNKIKVYRKKVS